MADWKGDISPSESRLKIAWNAVFGRLGGSAADPVEEGEGDEDWEDVDVDTARAAEIERKKNILKGQIARAAARSREDGTSMPVTKDGVKEAPKVRRTSIGRPQQKESATTTPNGGAAKRPRSTEAGKMEEPAESQ